MAAYIYALYPSSMIPPHASSFSIKPRNARHTDSPVLGSREHAPGPSSHRCRHGSPLAHALHRCPSLVSALGSLHAGVPAVWLELALDPEDERSWLRLPSCRARTRRCAYLRSSRVTRSGTSLIGAGRCRPFAGRAATRNPVLDV